MGYTISDPDCIIDYSRNRFCPAKEKIQGYKKHSRVFFVIFLQKTIFKKTKKKTLKSGDFCTVERPPAWKSCMKPWYILSTQIFIRILIDFEIQIVLIEYMLLTWSDEIS